MRLWPRQNRLTSALLAGACLAVATPSFAWLYLDARVTSGIEPALSNALGAPVTIGEIEAGVLGGLAVREIHLDGVATVAAIELAFTHLSGPLALLAGDSVDVQLQIDQPRVTVGPDRDRLRQIARQLDQRLGRRPLAAAGDGNRPSTSSPTRRERAGLDFEITHIAVTGGELVAEVPEIASAVVVSGISASGHPPALRAVAEQAYLASEIGPYAVRGRFPRLAVDLGPSGPTRCLAVEGSLEVTAPGAESLRLRDVALRQDGASSAVLVASGPRSSQLRVRIEGHPGAVRITAQNLGLAALAPVLPKGLDPARAAATGELTVSLATGNLPEILTGGLASGVQGEFSVRDLVIDDRRVADKPVSISGRASVKIAVEPRDGGARLELERIALEAGDLRVELRGRAEYDRAGALAGRTSWLPDRGDLAVSVPAQDCASALSAVPAAMRPKLTGLDLTGDFAASARVRFDRSDVEATELALDVDPDRCRVVREAASADPRQLKATFVHQFPDGTRGAIGRDQSSYTALARLPRHLVGGFVASEDARFYHHRGFDVHQIERSLAVDLRDAAFVRGGSTISQQLVKNVFLSHDRNLARKLQEAVLTWRLEARMSKAEILERYLNVIQLGPQVFGVGAAARYWFGKRARRLDPRESAFLIALTPAPNTISRRIAERGGIEGETARKIELVLDAMRAHGVLSKRAYQRAKNARLRLRRNLLARRP